MIYQFRHVEVQFWNLSLQTHGCLRMSLQNNAAMLDMSTVKRVLVCRTTHQRTIRMHHCANVKFPFSFHLHDVGWTLTHQDGITFLGVSSDHLSIMVYDKVFPTLPKAVKKTFSVTKAVYCGKAVFLHMLKLKQFFHISQFSMPSSTLINGHSMLNMSFLRKNMSFLWFVYALPMLYIMRFQGKDGPR